LIQLAARLGFPAKGTTFDARLFPAADARNGRAVLSKAVFDAPRAVRFQVATARTIKISRS
jgi:hypothetical protein